MCNDSWYIRQLSHCGPYSNHTSHIHTPLGKNTERTQVLCTASLCSHPPTILYLCKIQASMLYRCCTFQHWNRKKIHHGGCSQHGWAIMLPTIEHCRVLSTFKASVPTIQRNRPSMLHGEPPNTMDEPRSWPRRVDDQLEPSVVPCADSNVS